MQIKNTNIMIIYLQRPLEATRENTERLSLVDWLECDIVSILTKNLKYGKL